MRSMRSMRSLCSRRSLARECQNQGISLLMHKAPKIGSLPAHFAAHNGRCEVIMLLKEPGAGETLMQQDDKGHEVSSLAALTLFHGHGHGHGHGVFRCPALTLFRYPALTLFRCPALSL
jgi:hypothetical protein